MPAAFKDAGWLVSLIIVIILCFISYITTTFVIESMSVANAINKIKSLQKGKEVLYSHWTCFINNFDWNFLVTQNKYSLGSSQDVLQGNSSDNDSSAERLPLLEYNDNIISDHVNGQNESLFDIKQRIELGSMAYLFFNKIGVKLFYFCIAVYLYGDLAIYAASISKSLRDVTWYLQLKRLNIIDISLIYQ